MFPELANAELNSISDFALGSNCSVTWFAKHFSKDINVIFDRLHFSEYAYSIVKRKFNKYLAKDRFEIIDSQLALFNVKLIYLKCDYNSMVLRAKDKNKVYSQNDFYDLTTTFNEILKLTKLSTSIINTNNTKDEVLKQAINFIKD
jgi:thymidylate kinase